MKKLILLFLLIFLMSFGGYAQEFKTNGSTISVVYTVDSLSKQEIHQRINSAIATVYNSAQNVIQMNDVSAGKLIIKALTAIPAYNLNKILYPKMMKNIPDTFDIDHRYTLSFESRDGRYRMVLDLEQGTTTDTYGTRDFWYKSQFENYNTSQIEETKIYLDDMHKKVMMGKKKRALLAENIPDNMSKYIASINVSIKGLMNIISEQVKNSTEVNKLDDDW